MPWFCLLKGRGRKKFSDEAKTLARIKAIILLKFFHGRIGKKGESCGYKLKSEPGRKTVRPSGSRTDTSQDVGLEVGNEFILLTVIQWKSV